MVRGSWFVKAHHHSEWAVVKYHSGPPFGTAPTNDEPRTTNNKKALAVVPPIQPESRTSLSSCIPSHHQVTRFGISDSHDFARRKAPLLTMHYVYITFQAGRLTRSAPTSYEPLTTNHKKALAVVPPIQPNPGYLYLAVYFHTIRSRDSA